jgi:Ca2+-binding RTX toxin-like protein
MNENVKIKSIVFVAILAASLTFTQFLTLPAFALEFSITKVTLPDTDRFGWSVQRLDDGFVAGEPFADTNDSGLVHIFDSNGDLVYTITNPDGANNHFGYSLSALEGTLAVGAPGFSNNKGIVYLYDIGDTSPQFSISNPSGNNNERMGEDEMNFLNGDLLVGVSKAENGGKSQAGKIYLFSLSDGSQIQFYSNPSGTNTSDLFGRSISVDGTLFLSGAHGVAAEKGQAHVIGGPTTISFTNPNSDAPPEGDRYGWSTEITPTRYIVGAPRAEFADSDTVVQQGKVYLHHRDQPFIDIIISDDIGDIDSQNIEDQFGYDVAASNNLILVGAPYDDVEIDGTTYIDAGSVYLYSNSGLWIATIHNPDPQDNDLFGYSLDIVDGNVIVGAPGDDGDKGAVYSATVSNEFAATLTIDADPNPVASGAPLTITYIVKNIGTADILDAVITITDPTCSPIDGPFGDIDDDGVLSVLEEWAFVCEKTAPESAFSESIDEEATFIDFSPDGIEGQTITCGDPGFDCSGGSVNVGISTASMTIDISAVPDTIYGGQTSDVTFTVTNTGNISLFIHGETGIVDQNGNCNPTTNILDVIRLDSQATVDFTCTVTGETSPINIDAIATATDESNNEVIATDTFTVNVIVPEITLDISAEPDPVRDGEQTTITYTVTNTGNSPLTIDGQTGISEQNTDCVPFAQAGTITLQPSDIATFTCTVTAELPSVDFNAIATALDQNNNEVTAEATLAVNVIAPEITLDISSDPNPVNSGSTSLVTYTVTNTGNSPLTIDGQTGISEQNTDCVPFAQAGTITLQPSDIATFTCTVTAGTSQFNFDATATAVDENNGNVIATAQHTLHVASLTLDIVPIPLQPIPGSSPTIEFTVTNNGSVVFDTISVDEILNADCTPTTTETGPLNPGEGRIFECVVPNVTGDFDIQGVATGTYTGGVGQIVVQKTITVDVFANLFCGRPESDFDQVITGTAGNDNIKGSNGDDLIFGLAGNDKIQGKNGNDCIFGDDGDDKIWGDKGDDTIDGGTGNDQIHGQQGNDTLIGGDGNDKLWGGQGNDIIEGNTGNDQIHGQQGNDTLTGGDGDDKIYGGQGNDIIDAGSGNDIVHANQGNDVVTGGDGDDWLGAGTGNDEVSGGAGNDKIFGRPGNDILNGDDGDDYIHGGQGNDTVNGGDGDDKIFGQQGHDILNGNDNDDYIHGGQGNDNIDGGDGDNDRCNGAQGNNTIINCEVEDKKMKEEKEENDDDEGESEDDDDN